jgi:RHS repeat-associated protein
MSGLTPCPVGPANTVLVGDPVDVISGVQYDVALDFRIAWAVPFEWRRFYSTARVGEHLALGWGHTHSYDHRLRYDTHGLVYLDPSGRLHEFEYPEVDGMSVMCGTTSLRRLTPTRYRVKAGGHPGCEFEFKDPTRPAQLRRVLRGRSYQELRYGPDGRWTEIAHEDEPTVRVECDTDGRVHMLITTDPATSRDRLLWQGRYDHASNLVSVTDPYQATQTFAYDDAHRMVGRTDRRDYAFVASYDEAGRCERSAGVDGVQEVRLRYHPAEGATRVTKADGGEWQYFHGPEGVTAIIDPYAGVTRRIYGEGGRLVEEIGPSGEVLRQVVDDETGLLRAPFSPPEGMCLLLGDPWFDPARRLEVPRDALGWEGYGEFQSRQAIRLPVSTRQWLRELPAVVGRSIRLAENVEQAGDAAIVVDDPPLPRITQAPKKPMGVPDRPGIMRHDAFGALLSHTLPTGETAHWRYDANGNVARHVDYAGSEWQYDYASWNLRVREVDPLGHATTLAYDRSEHPTHVTDAGGTTTEKGYDLKDRVVERRRHGEPRDRFEYDRSLGLAKAVASDAVRVTMKAGPHGRPVEIAPVGRAPRQCGYDDRGRLIEVTAEDGESIAFSYEGGNRTSDMCNGRGVQRAYAQMRLASCVVLERFAIEYAYDEAANQTTIVDPLGGRHVVQQLDSGVHLRRHANGTEELSQFDWNGRCLVKVRFRRAEKYQSWSRVYRYSPVGALLTVLDSERGNWSYRYDAAHRLVNASHTSSGQQGFAYDAAGNLISAPTLDDARYSENRLVAASGRRFEYDRRHHISREIGREGQRQYEYDSEDRLVLCHVGRERVDFRYDALGRRIEKTTGEGTTQFVWDGERLAAEISPNGMLRVYVYADGMALTPFAFIDYDSVDDDPATGRRYFVFANQICCPTRVENDAGQSVWSADIDAYGRATIRRDSTIELNLRWPGHYYDRETDLHYNRFRYYSPTLGRYIQVDPKDIEGGINIYAYPSRPLDQVDVDGLAPCPKKAMVKPDEDDPAYQKAKKRADEIAEDMRAALQKAIESERKKGNNTQALENTTLAAMVVQRKNGQYKVVVTANRNPEGLPQRVQEAAGGAKWVGHGDDRPPMVRKENESHRYSRPKGRPPAEPDGPTRDASTHNHAEQRGLRAADCDNDAKGVAYVAPTRPCCEGCSTAMQTKHNSKDPTNKGGWGGNGDNVSDRGKEPGPHGDHW